MTDSIYNIPDLRQKIKELTGEENFPLLREQDVIKIKPVILQYLNNCSNECELCRRVTLTLDFH